MTMNDESQVPHTSAGVTALDLDQLTAKWPDTLRELPDNVRSAWQGGNWKAVHDDGTAVFLVPNQWRKSVCEESRKDVEGVLCLTHGVDDVQVEILTPNEFLLGDEATDENDSYSEKDEISAETAVGAALGQTIQRARKKAGLSQRELGQRAGTDQTAISSWERGVVVPGLDRIFRLDLAFGLQPGTLLVRAGLIRPEAIEAARRRSTTRYLANVTNVTVSFDGGATAEIGLPPSLTVEQWLELVRTMLGDGSASAVTAVTVTATNDERSSMKLPPGEYSLEEVLRLIEIMVDAQGEYDPSPPPPQRYDPAEEPF